MINKISNIVLSLEFMLVLYVVAISGLFDWNLKAMEILISGGIIGAGLTVKFIKRR